MANLIDSNGNPTTMQMDKTGLRESFTNRFNSFAFTKGVTISKAALDSLSQDCTDVVAVKHRLGANADSIVFAGVRNGVIQDSSAYNFLIGNVLSSFPSNMGSFVLNAGDFQVVGAVGVATTVTVKLYGNPVSNPLTLPNYISNCLQAVANYEKINYFMSASFPVASLRSMIGAGESLLFIPVVAYFIVEEKRQHGDYFIDVYSTLEHETLAAFKLNSQGNVEIINGVSPILTQETWPRKYPPYGNA